MKYISTLLFCCLFLTICSCAQPTAASHTNGPIKGDKVVGGSCEDCAAIYDSPFPFNQLPATLEFVDFKEKGPKMLVNGIVYQRDGRTPAANVVIYVYHTDQKGVYPRAPGATGYAQRHGYIRGWLKTGADGRYSFKTLRPANYPNSRIPAHIHITVKEPGKTAYWMDEFMFSDDPYLPAVDSRERKFPKGGDGILKLVNKNGLLTANRDIILGLNIDDYAGASSPGTK